MISEEDKRLVQEAKGCDSCLQWHKHCNAECCLTVFLNVSPALLKEKGSFIDFRSPISFDERWYYKLRGVRYVHGVLRFPKSDCRVLRNEVIFIRKCELLTDDLKCLGHPDKKPQVCRMLNAETAKLKNRGYRVTPHCLFRYKLMEGDVDEQIGDGRDQETKEA